MAVDEIPTNILKQYVTLRKKATLRRMDDRPTVPSWRTVHAVAELKAAHSLTRLFYQ